MLAALDRGETAMALGRLGQNMDTNWQGRSWPVNATPTAYGMGHWVTITKDANGTYTVYDPASATGQPVAHPVSASSG
ncbi:hypothetical protein CGZ93_16260 [Enemella dayhoffiae]|uniref:Uncharacterized protein n=1 Tax=Enemella dayhoffiae TaxID=2016507 RepID=A0A255GTQ3_9ACTN|nr:hypothetical protein [Enemella dayhoffiae]OYO18106.1 hypothetical protein CGZ93_16260 [Enemella dayhoffiae]